MKIEMMNKVMNTLLIVSSLAILVGAIFKLQHYPNGNLILWIGLLSHFILSSFEISRMKKTIAKSNTLVNEDERQEGEHIGSPVHQ